MHLQFTERPDYIDPVIYDQSIKAMAERLLDTGKVKCVFQVGGVSSPGISDLDLYAVFYNDKIYTENPVSKIGFPQNYLFSHKLFGTSEKLAPQMERFTFFGKYNYIAGEMVNMFDFTINDEETKILKPQIALEYLVKAWITASTSIAFRTVKIRSFLLHAKAVQYDINFLGIKNEALTTCINRVIETRNNWFSQKISDHELENLFFDYHKALSESLQEYIRQYHFYLPVEANKKIAGKIYLRKSGDINISRYGILIPSFMTARSSFFRKVNNRFNTFHVEIPITSENIPPVLQERHHIIKSAFEYNRRYLPYFICTGHGLDIFTHRI